MNEASDTASATVRPASVFVSYTRADRKQARVLVELIEEAGFSVWWDAHIEAGAQFQRITEQALESAKAVIVVWSERSVESAWVHDEATRGRERQCLVPVSIDGTPPPLGFRQYQFIDLSKGRMKSGTPEVGQVLARIGELAEREDVPVRTAKPRYRISRRAVFAGAGAAVVAAGGAYFIGGRLTGSKPQFGSIAVLPFANLSGDPSQDYFSDGLSEELRATLSLSRQLSVAAQTSSNSFRGQDASATEIARKLKVSHILDGSVRRSNDTVRISTQLINRDGFEEWAGTFDREMADIFDVQTEISYLVADALVQTLAENEEESFVRVGGTSNPDAYDAFLQGRALYNLAADEETDRNALAMFERAIALDPKYAAAHAARSRALTVIANVYSSGQDLAEYYAQSVAAARQAVEIAPELADGHSALGFILFNGQLDVRAAEEPYRRSYELGFGNAEILARYAIFAGRIGEFESAREAIERAEELDPLNPEVFRNSAVIEYDARNFEVANDLLREALALNPDMVGTYDKLGQIALLSGDLAAARRYFEQEPARLAGDAGLVIVDLKQGDVEAGESRLQGLIERYGNNCIYQQAQVKAQTGEVADALTLLEKAYDEGDAGLVQMRNDPLFDPLRDEQRFGALLDRIGFEDGSNN